LYLQADAIEEFSSSSEVKAIIRPKEIASSLADMSSNVKKEVQVPDVSEWPKPRWRRQYPSV
jgi:H2-forming N5,N10-methylenetetrahydromethanopterin dehydrogenase-like enzyme